MKNRISVVQFVYDTQGKNFTEPFRLVEHVETDTDGVRSRLTSKSFKTLDEAKEVLKRNGY